MAWTPPAADKPWTPPSSDKPAEAGDYDVPGTSPEARAIKDDDAVGEAEAFEQGALFDPIEAVGQMLPTRVSGAISSVIPQSVKDYAAESAKGAERHPGWRTAGNIAPWMFVPGGGPIADVGIGALSGALQPTDPKDPNFWTNKGLQAGAGGTLGGVLGWIGRGISESLQKAAAATKAYQQAAGRAVTAQVKQDFAHTDAVQAVQNAHAQAMQENAAQAAKVMADHHKAVSDQMGALHSHLGAVVSTATRNAERMQQHAADSGEHILNEARLRTEYAQNKAAFDAEMAARRQLNQQENVNWMRRALSKVGLADKTPTQAGDAALDTTRNLIGGKLNEANAQLSLNPGAVDLVGRLRGIGNRLTMKEGEGALLGDSDKAVFDELLRNRVLSPIAEALHDDAGNFVGWQPKGELSGEQFAKYVTMLNQEADNLARGARFPGKDTENHLKMAHALHDMVDVIEDSAEGPAAAKTLRDQARDAYRTYSTLSSSADPTKLSIADPTSAVKQVQRRLGTADRYRAALANPESRYHEDAQHARSWLQQSMVDKPAKPAEPKIPKPPKEPKLEKTPSAPTAAMKDVKEPVLPKEPKLDLPKPPPKVPMPKPPTQSESPATLAGQTAARGLAHLGAYHAGHMLGMPVGLPNIMLETARAAAQHAPGTRGPVKRATQSAMQKLGSRPGVAGKVPAVSFDILGITPSEGTNGDQTK